MIASVRFVGKILIYIIVLLALGIVIGGYGVGKVNEVRDFFFPETAAYVRSPQTIVNSISGIGQLVTVTSEVETTDVKVEIHGGFLNAGYYSANHMAIGAIEAGIDFDALTEDSVRYENDAYTLTLPAPIITSCRIEYIDQGGHSFTLLVAKWDMVRQIAHAEAITRFAEQMIEAGILERAAEETALRLGDFVRELTGKPTHIEFAARDGELDLPDSCQPYTPPGWGKDETGAWKRTG
ncbi:MAG: DUF4230 domain-containing protein [Chloroflexi bacterium]|nr:DUF4230 domain-containing protein [Chloroflexota bacterium]